MAKKTVNTSGNVVWENKLPSVYRTMVDGFHAELTVKEFVAYLGYNDADIPEGINDIKIRSFTPQMFSHPKLKNFWQTPVSSDGLKEDHPSVHFALCDPDVNKIQASTKYNIDPEKPTFEMLARLLSTQQCAYNHRMAQLMRDNLLARLKKLEQPEFYNKLRNCKFVTNNGLQSSLPKEPIEIQLVDNKFNVKDPESSIRKAYKEKEFDYAHIDSRADLNTSQKQAMKDDIVLEKFLAGHDSYGTSRVRDVLRTSIIIPRDNILQSQKHKRFEEARNVLYVAMNSGDLGMVCHEFVDSVNYPPSSRLVDLYPVANAKGELYHAGLNGTVISLAMEAQIKYIREDLINRTHENHEIIRAMNVNTPERRELRQELEDESTALYNSGMGKTLILNREEHLRKIDALESGNPDAISADEIVASIAVTDKIGALIVKEGFCQKKKFMSNSMDISYNAQFFSRHAANVALSEFPEDEKIANKSKKPLQETINRFEIGTPAFIETMNVMVRKHEPKVLEMYPGMSDSYKKKQAYRR